MPDPVGAQQHGVAEAAAHGAGGQRSRDQVDEFAVLEGAGDQREPAVGMGLIVIAAGLDRGDAPQRQGAASEARTPRSVSASSGRWASLAAASSSLRRGESSGIASSVSSKAVQI